MRQITGAEEAGEVTMSNGKPKMPHRGLHHCRYYDNLVKYNPTFCGKCPHNGFMKLDDAQGSDTCF